MYIHVIRFYDYTSDLDRVNSAPPGSSRKSFILSSSVSLSALRPFQFCGIQLGGWEGDFNLILEITERVIFVLSSKWFFWSLETLFFCVDRTFVVNYWFIASYVFCWYCSLFLYIFNKIVSKNCRNALGIMAKPFLLLFTISKWMFRHLKRDGPIS